MEIGLNHEVELGGKVFHIQSEDLGLTLQSVLTQVFHQGEILLKRTVSYADAIKDIDDPTTRSELIRRYIKALHKACFNQLKSELKLSNHNQ
jgi:hypothetical protein